MYVVLFIIQTTHSTRACERAHSLTLLLIMALSKYDDALNYSCRLRSRNRTPFNSAPSRAVNDVMYSQTSVAIPAPNDP